ncbi:MAG: triose-phosphate isomerase [Planctomycetes bacterium]|nr:triose-phosphate isomerase [Planctomycetota bacterium]
MRKSIIGGNWKMNMRASSAKELASALRPLGSGDCEVVLFPPFVYLKDVADAVRGSGVHVGGQNCHSEPDGAFTGEISAEMLKDSGADYVLLGHSERRAYHDGWGESSSWINAKLTHALGVGLKAILCVGETIAEREAGRTNDVLGGQLRQSLAGISAERTIDVVIAYEPVWAIGTGKTATPQMAEGAHAFIRGVIGRMWDEGIAQQMRIQYGGSVKASNARELLSQTDIDGALVGGASLSADEFAAIVKAAK